jgi:polyhydroxyalkanoate synthesis regulator phasin
MSKRKICVATGSRAEYDALKAEIEELEGEVRSIRNGRQAA